MRSFQLLLIAVLSTCLMVLGCGDDSAVDDGSPAADPGLEDDGSPAADPGLEEEERSLNCGGPSSAERYFDGISKVSASGRYTVTIVSSDPAPPSKGDNSLVLQVTEEGSAVVDASVLVSPFMPHHDHGTSPADYAGAPVEDGLVELPAFYLFMPGYWEYTVAITGADGVGDSVVFSFCVDG
jgi:hypothetical protein